MSGETALGLQAVGVALMGAGVFFMGLVLLAVLLERRRPPPPRPSENGVSRNARHADSDGDLLRDESPTL